MRCGPVGALYPEAPTSSHSIKSSLLPESRTPLYSPQNCLQHVRCHATDTSCNRISCSYCPSPPHHQRYRYHWMRQFMGFMGDRLQSSASPSLLRQSAGSSRWDVSWCRPRDHCQSNPSPPVRRMLTFHRSGEPHQPASSVENNPNLTMNLITFSNPAKAMTGQLIVKLRPTPSSSSPFAWPTLRSQLTSTSASPTSKRPSTAAFPVSYQVVVGMGPWAATG